MNRIRTLTAAAALSVLCGIAGPVQTSHAGVGNAPAALSPSDALDLLVAGNRRFVNEQPERRNADISRVIETGARGQSPFATIISSSDSRVPVEYIFDRGIGDLFVVRSVGNTSGPHQVGSVEFGVDHLGTSVLVVLGNTGCSAVAAACSNAEVSGNIKNVLAPIAPAATAARNQLGEGADEKMIVELAVRYNVFQTIGDLIRQSPTITERVNNGQLRVVGAVYDLNSGRIDWMGEHPRQSDLIASAVAQPQAVSLGSSHDEHVQRQAEANAQTQQADQAQQPSTQQASAPQQAEEPTEQKKSYRGGEFKNGRYIPARQPKRSAGAGSSRGRQ